MSVLFPLSEIRLLVLFIYVQIKAIEDEIDLGQIEEVIEMAKDEINVVNYYIGKTHPF